MYNEATDEPAQAVEVFVATTSAADVVSTIKVLIAKGDKAADKAQQFYISAGQHLKVLKSDYTASWSEWEKLLKEKCQLSTGRASELMQIADGRKTVAEVRAAKAESVRKLRARSSLRSEEVVVKEVTEAERELAEFKAAKVTNAPADPEAVIEARKAAFAAEEDHEPEPTDKDRKKALLIMAGSAIESAQALQKSRIKPDAEILDAVRYAVSEWSALEDKLEPRTAETLPTEAEAEKEHQATLYDQGCRYLELMTDETRQKFFAYLKKSNLAAAVIQEECEGCDSEEERWHHSLSAFAGDAIAISAFWEKQFGDWKRFSAPSHLVTLADQAAQAWEELAGELRSLGRVKAAA
jgi:hypothetical protein